MTVRTIFRNTSTESVAGFYSALAETVRLIGLSGKDNHWSFRLNVFRGFLWQRNSHQNTKCMIETDENDYVYRTNNWHVLLI